ncbi:S8 family serine peptidase [Kribbella deserti]|uniref:S8 family serine peptidase n=1 Tax=Kribbella deserti TaxID=1926257 RepID=A0ABV6QN26_9ACTN
MVQVVAPGYRGISVRCHEIAGNGMMKVRVVAAMLVAGIAGTMGVPSGVAATGAISSGGRTDAGAATTGSVATVTLVTGDQVVVRRNHGSDQVLTIRPAKGREGMQFIRRKENGGLQIIPVDAAALVATQRVDRRLFNVTKLLTLGYGDSSRTDIPLITKYQPGTERNQGRLTLRSTKLLRELHPVSADVRSLPKATAAEFWKSVKASPAHGALAPGISKIWLDGKVSATLDQSVAQIGAPLAWQSGHRGQGVKVAVLDSGVDSSHPDLAAAVVAEKDFTESPSGAADRVGHGTHVAGIITGSGGAFNGKYQGVAPDAVLLNGKVLDDSGTGSDSGIIAGMEWAVAQGADVVNLSLASDFFSDGIGPMDLAVNELTEKSGTLFVVAAGNNGPVEGSITSPGAADSALTVGAVDAQDELADFSGRGPRVGDLALKPDITAPGVSIAAALAKDSLMGESSPVVDGAYVRLSGTSMAAPHVAGAAAILAALRPTWKAGELKAALMGSATPHRDQTTYEQGAGRLQVSRAVLQESFALPASISKGITRWPHHDDERSTDTITYVNKGTTPLVLTLTVESRGPDGKVAPSGMFALSAGEVTVPAGGSASVTLVTDTSVGAIDGVYTGRVKATGGTVSIQTPFGVTREPESYDLTLVMLDRNGHPAADHFARLVGIERPQIIHGYDPSGRVTLRVAKGEYYFEGLVATPDQDPDSIDPTLSVLVEPGLQVDSDATVVIDARRAKSSGFSVDQPDAAAIQREYGFRRTTDYGEAGSDFVSGQEEIFVAPSLTSADPSSFSYRVDGHYARPDGAEGFTESPYLYHLSRTDRGRVPVGLVRHVRDAELHAVHTQIAATSAEQIVSKDFMVELSAPATFVEYYSPAVPFLSSAFVLPEWGSAEPSMETIAPVVNHPLPGKSKKRWHVGPFAPALAPNPLLGVLAGRVGNSIEVVLPFFSDQQHSHLGFIQEDSAVMTLRRGGKVIGETSNRNAVFEVPAKSGRYQLAFRATQSVSSVSTSISTAWNFKSGAVPDDGMVPLPLMTIRFSPDLDEHNRATTGRFLLPLTIQRQTGIADREVRRLRVQVSYDDGRTWRPVTVVRSGLRRAVLLDHPNRGEFVSLRTEAADADGNTVHQTLIRAYALKAQS